MSGTSTGFSTTLSEATSEYWKSPAGITRRIEMLCDSFTYKIVNNALIAYGETGGITRWQWVTAGDERVCPICGPLDGRVYRRGQFLPSLPAHANCLTPETEVNTHRGLIAIKNVDVGDHVLTHRGRYKQVIQLHKNSYKGRIYGLSGTWLTRNHPVLTPKGWATIDSIEDGDQVFSITSGRHRNLSPSDLYSDEPPPTSSKEVFLSSIEPPLRLAGVPVASVNFDGDLQIGNGEVQVIDIESMFGDNGNLRLREDIEEFGFERGHRALKLYVNGSSDSLLSRGFASSRRIVSGANLGTSLIRGHLTPQKLLGFALASNVNAGVDKPIPDGTSGYSEVFGYFVFGDAINIHFNDFLIGQPHFYEDPELVSRVWHKPITITTIDTDTYKGCVYNLSVDEDESYTIGKQRIIVHNCRCQWELMFEPGEIPRYVV